MGGTNIMGYKNNEKINEVLAKIDLTKTQRERAKDLYTNICKSIIRTSGLDINFYSQGSFATKTAVRPFKDGKDRSYDVDVICEVQNLDKSITPSKLMDIFEETIDSAGYHDYTRWEKCFTVAYAKIDDIEFTIDIIPSVAESFETLEKIRQETERIELVETSIAIPDVAPSYNKWISNNPLGYKAWFENQTQAYEKKYEEFRKGIFDSTIEELPEDAATNLMRNVIKILKRLRDVYFSRTKTQSKPSSIVITTIVAKLANKLSYAQDEFTLLNLVVSELQQLESFSRGKSIQKSLNEGFMISEIIALDNDQWILKNPANGSDNILSSWNEETQVAKDFFNWVSDLRSLVESQTSSNIEDIQKSEMLYDSLHLDFSSIKEADFEVNSAKASPWRVK